MLYDPVRHEPLSATAWDAEQVRATLARIVSDVEDRFTPERYWPPHPLDLEPGDPPDEPFAPLYLGACGVIWALHYLQDLGAVRLRRDYLQGLDELQQRNRAWLAASFAGSHAAAYLMGDTPYALLAGARTPGCGAAAETLAALIAANLEHPARELMWGSPGTMLAALWMHELTAQARWAELFRRTAGKLESQLLWSEPHGCAYWTQDLYGKRYSFLDGIHGFVATAAVLIKGRHLLAAPQWRDWERCIVNTVSRSASQAGAQVNWRCELLAADGAAPPTLMQFCHGAPGFIICLAELPGPDLDALLLRAGETVWTAGPLRKGASLCHGTAGNGYALLKLYQRTGDRSWLQRARAFAMHALDQSRAAASLFGQHRYSLWTGDLGLAVYLWDCLRGAAAFPTLDVFFAAPPRADAG
jgi:hypothetical protein